MKIENISMNSIVNDVRKDLFFYLIDFLNKRLFIFKNSKLLKMILHAARDESPHKTVCMVLINFSTVKFKSSIITANGTAIFLLPLLATAISMIVDCYY
jgi:hypothetical protein